MQHSLFPDPRRAEFQGRAHLDFHVDDIGDLIEVWTGFAGSFNELNRSMGKPDPYPFTLSQQVVVKLGFVHELVRDARLPDQSGWARGSDQSGSPGLRAADRRPEHRPGVPAGR